MYTIYYSNYDTEVFERPDGTKDINKFVFIGFRDGIHPYHQKQTEWAIEMLKSADIHLHVQQVDTVSKMCKDPYAGEMAVEDLLMKEVPVKEGMRNMVLFQDTEMGRGWAVLLEIKDDNSMEIITQEHRDTVRDQTLLDKKWLTKQGVKVTRKKVKNIEKII